MADAMMSWHIVTSTEYAAGTKVDGDLYFLSDTHEVYRGSESYTQSIGLYTGTLPTNPAKGRIYFNSATLQGDVYDGTTWTTVIKAVTDTVAADGVNPVTGKAVADYVTAALATISTSANTIKDISYDSTEHILTLTKGDDSTSTIVLAGLGCSLSFTSNSLQLLDASGNAIGDAVNLDVERFVKGGEYDTTTKSIVLWFDDATDAATATDKVTIPVADLVDEYTVESSTTIDLTMVSNKISAALKISAEEGNAIVQKDDGIYVPSVDTSDFITKVPGATEGNIPVLDADGNLVDSGVSTTDIGQATLYQGASIEEAVGVNTPKKGDICIVTTPIGETDKSSKTAYFYDGAAWVAMDGNVNADNVYFASDLLTTSAVGNITLTNGQATIPAAGKNLTEVFNTIFVAEKNPSITQPAVTISAPQNKAYEVGTTVTPTYTATLSTGTYQYGPATGITASSWAVTDTAGHSASTNTGSFDALVVEDATNYTITATATYGDGAIPVTNTGNEYAAGQILAGTASKTSAAITGYRAGFYGTLLTSDGEINSDLVRSLSTKTTAAVKAGTVWNITIPVGATRVVFAYPATIRDVSSVIDVNGLNAEIKTAFGDAIAVDVEGANAYTAAAYKVYVLDFAKPNDTANTYKVTL